MDIPYAKTMIQKCENEKDIKKIKELIVYNPNYSTNGTDWIEIVRGKDLESILKGELILWNNGQINRIKNSDDLIKGKSDLKYYYYLN